MGRKGDVDRAKAMRERSIRNVSFCLIASGDESGGVPKRDHGVPHDGCVWCFSSSSSSFGFFFFPFLLSPSSLLRLPSSGMEEDDSESECHAAARSGRISRWSKSRSCIHQRKRKTNALVVGLRRSVSFPPCHSAAVRSREAGERGGDATAYPTPPFPLVQKGACGAFGHPGRGEREEASVVVISVYDIACRSFPTPNTHGVERVERVDMPSAYAEAE